MIVSQSLYCSEFVHRAGIVLGASPSARLGPRGGSEGCARSAASTWGRRSRSVRNVALGDVTTATRRRAKEAN